MVVVRTQTGVAIIVSGQGLPGPPGGSSPHAANHEDGGSDELIIENLPTAGAVGSVPTSDGAGGLAMSVPSGSGNVISPGGETSGRVTKMTGSNTIDETATTETQLATAVTHSGIVTGNPHALDATDVGAEPSGSIATHAALANAHHAESHAFAGTEHSSSTLANVNAKISDATLDTSSAARPPNGSATGDLSGSYPAPVVDGIQGQAVSGTTPTEGQVLVHTSGTWTPAAQSGGGEVNTASNVGTDGVGVFRQKTGDDLEFRHVAPGSTKVTTTLNGQDIDVDVVEANIVHQSISGAGTNTHAQIDTHIANEPAAGIATHAALANAHHNEAHAFAGAEHSTSNLAAVNSKITDATLDTSSASRPPNGSASGDLSSSYPGPTVAKIQGEDISGTTPNEGEVLTFQSSVWTPAAAAGGAPTGSAGGDLAATYPNPEVAAIHETSGPTKLTIGSIADGEFAKRVGSTLVGSTPAGGGDFVGPAVAVDGNLVDFDTTTGKLGADSGIAGADVIQRDGSVAFTGDVDLGGQAITNVGNVDGVDVGAHVADLANPHATDLENLGSGTRAELNAAVSDTTLVGVDGSSTDNALSKFDGTTGLIQNTGIIVDDSNNMVFTGSIEMSHTATGDDDHALELIVNAAGFSDVKALGIDYITGAIGTGDSEEAILINIDESASTGGRIAAFEVLATDSGGSEVDALEVGAGVHPILQISGVFEDAESILVIAVNQLTALSDGGAGNISVHVNDDDTITVGHSNQYEELEIIVDTGASNPGITPVFHFSTGVGTWTSFGPADGTNGFRNTGIIAWILADIPSWAPGTGSEYLIRITRTQNALATTPILDLIQIAQGTNYHWNKDGHLIISGISSDFGITDAADITKVATFDVSAITTATTRTISVPDEDITLDGTGDTRPPAAHDLAGADHNSATAAEFNAKISDANFDDAGDSRPPDSHAFAGAEHSTSNLAAVNSKITDATLDDSGDSRPPNGTAGGDLNGTYPNPSVDDGADSTAFHTGDSGDISGLTLKATPTGADHLFINDDASSDAPRRVLISSLPTGSDADAIHDNVAGEIVAITEKTAPLGDDEFVIESAADSDAKRSAKLRNIVPVVGLFGIDTALGTATVSSLVMTHPRALLVRRIRAQFGAVTASGTYTFLLRSGVDLDNLSTVGTVTVTSGNSSGASGVISVAVAALNTTVVELTGVGTHSGTPVEKLCAITMEAELD